jgi:hypothetical protein
LIGKGADVAAGKRTVVLVALGVLALGGLYYGLQRQQRVRGNVLDAGEYQRLLSIQLVFESFRALYTFFVPC